MYQKEMKHRYKKVVLFVESFALCVALFVCL